MPTIHHSDGAPVITIEDIARTCHEVNRAFCLSLDDASHLPWNEAPEWQQESSRKGVQFHLDHPSASVQTSHESWMEEKLQAGWVYGAKKDPVEKTHPCLVPFEQLPIEQQTKDYLFRAVVHALLPILGRWTAHQQDDVVSRQWNRGF